MLSSFHQVVHHPIGSHRIRFRTRLWRHPSHPNQHPPRPHVGGTVVLPKRKFRWQNVGNDYDSWEGRSGLRLSSAYCRHIDANIFFCMIMIYLKPPSRPCVVIPQPHLQFLVDRPIPVILSAFRTTEATRPAAKGAMLPATATCLVGAGGGSCDRNSQKGSNPLVN